MVVLCMSSRRAPAPWSTWSTRCRSPLTPGNILVLGKGYILCKILWLWASGCGGKNLKLCFKGIMGMAAGIKYKGERRDQKRLEGLKLYLYG